MGRTIHGRWSRHVAAALAVVVLLTAAAPASAGVTVGSSGGAVVAKAAKSKAHPTRKRRHKKRRHRPTRTSPQGQAAAPTASAGLPAPNAPAALTTCADATLVPTPVNLDRVRAATLCLINQERAKVGQGALTEQPQLEGAATGHVADMLARNFYDHVTPDGRTTLTRVTATGYLAGAGSYVIGENLAYATGDDSPGRIVAAWMASPDHRENILTPEFRDSGIAVAAAVPAFASDGLPGALYAQDFGVRAS
jgi:uncharacterized protein YkwD